MAWNKPSTENQQQKKPSAKAPSAKRGIIAGAVVVALGVLCLWLFSGNETRQDDASAKGRGLIKEVTPAVAAPTNAVPKKPVDPKEDYDHAKMYRDKDGILRYKNGNHRAYDRSKTHIEAKDYADHSKALFHHPSERVIHRLLTIRPGSNALLDRHDYYSESFQKDFFDSMKEPIIVTKDDSPRVAEEKRAMNEAKIEIADRLRNGENLGDILTELRKNVVKVNEFQKSVTREMRQLMKERGAELTRQDAEDYIDAANRLFEEKGISPIKKDAFIRWNLRLGNTSTDVQKGK